MNGPGCVMGKIRGLELILALPLILTNLDSNLAYCIRIRGEEKLVMCVSPSLILLSLGNRAGCWGQKKSWR